MAVRKLIHKLIQNLLCMPYKYSLLSHNISLRNSFYLLPSTLLSLAAANSHLGPTTCIFSTILIVPFCLVAEVTFVLLVGCSTYHLAPTTCVYSHSLTGYPSFWLLSTYFFSGSCIYLVAESLVI
jgi:hypothetical protein